MTRGSLETATQLKDVETMLFRSLLFVPADRPDRLVKAHNSAADAIIVDLEDAVAPARKDAARQNARSFLESLETRERVVVRVNALDSGMLDDDLEALKSAPPPIILLPKVTGAADISAVAAMLEGWPTQLMALAMETPGSLLGAGGFVPNIPLLCGMTWGAEDMAAELGMASARAPDGSLAEPLRLARSMALFAAKAANVPAIETVFANHTDTAGLDACARQAAADGFTGMLAIHPKQVPIINAAFSPSPAALERAEAIVAAFAEQEGAGAMTLDGAMIDQPHLRWAQRILALPKDA